MTAFTDRLLDCLCTGVKTSLGGDVCYCAIVPGAQVAMDHCGPCSETPESVCGMAWARLNRIYPSTRFPQPDFTVAGCGSPLAYEWQAGVFRCVPTVNEEMEPPTAADQITASLVQIDDARAVYEAILCCAAQAPPGARWGPADTLVGVYTPVGPSGACGGGFWTFTTREA